MTTPRIKPRTTLLILVTVLILLAFNLPNYLGYIFTPDGVVFSGQAFAIDPWDINVYVSAINWAQRFGFEYQNAYTSIPHKSIILYPLYTIVGSLFPDTNSFLLYHILIIVAGTLLIYTLYWSLSKFAVKQGGKHLTVLLSLFGGGIGFLFYNKLKIADVYLSPFTFSSSLEKPHEMLAISLYTLALTTFYIGVKWGRSKHFVISAVFAFGFTVFYPYHLLSYLIIIFIFSFYEAIKINDKLPLVYLFKIAPIVVLFGAAYSFYVASSSSFEGVFFPNNLPPTNLVLLILGYGIFAILYVFHLLRIRRVGLEKLSNQLVFLNIWFLASLFLTYLPISFSRYFLRGLFFPLVIISLHEFNLLIKNSKISKKILIALIVTTASATSIFFILLRSIAIFNPNNEWFYIPSKKYEAIEYIKNNAPAGSGVIANYPLSNHIPAHTSTRVYFGHEFQTPDAKQKESLQNSLLSENLGKEEAKKFLSDNKVDFIILDNQIDDELDYQFLDIVFNNESVSIYSFQIE